MAEARGVHLLLVMMLVGCGVESGSSPDARSADAANTADAMEPDAAPACMPSGAPGLVTVEAGVPGEATHEIFVHDPDGAVLSQAAVDASGIVTVEVPSCGMVTLVVQPEFSSRDYYVTWVHVQPGDRIVAPRRPRWEQVEFQVEFAAYPGATSYQFSGSFFGETTVTESPAALRQLSVDGEVAVLGVALGVTPLVWSGTVASSPGVPIDPWQTATTDVSVSLTGLPPAVSTPQIQLDFVVGDIALPFLSEDLAATDGSASVGPTTAPDGFGTGRISALLDHVNLSGDQVQIARAPASAQVTFDYVDLLPLPATFDVSGAAPRQDVAWTAERDPGEADVVILELHSDPIVWYVIAPPTVRALKLPALPAGLRPTESLGAHTIALADIGDVTTYADALARTPELNEAGFTASLATFRMSLLGDLDPRIIELQ